MSVVHNFIKVLDSLPGIKGINMKKIFINPSIND